MAERCFRDYDRCIGHSGGIVDNLDCAVQLVACIKREIFAPATPVRTPGETAAAQSGGGIAGEVGAAASPGTTIEQISLVDAINAVILANQHFSRRIEKGKSE